MFNGAVGLHQVLIGQGVFIKCLMGQGGLHQVFNGAGGSSSSV